MSWASEDTLRWMILKDTGHVPQQSTVRKALYRLHQDGTLIMWHLLPGGIMPDGGVCTHGTRLVKVLFGDERRHWQASQKKRRQRVQRTTRAYFDAREAGRMIERVAAAKRASADAKASPESLHERRDVALRALGDLAARWDREDGGRGPP